MQMEADQQLAALQQQSHPSHQRDWANGPMGNVQVFHGHYPNGTLNGAAAQDGTGMMTQESPILEDSPPNQARFAGALSSQHHTANKRYQNNDCSNTLGAVQFFFSSMHDYDCACALGWEKHLTGANFLSIYKLETASCMCRHRRLSSAAYGYRSSRSNCIKD